MLKFDTDILHGKLPKPDRPPFDLSVSSDLPGKSSNQARKTQRGNSQAVVNQQQQGTTAANNQQQQQQAPPQAAVGKDGKPVSAPSVSKVNNTGGGQANQQQGFFMAARSSRSVLCPDGGSQPPNSQGQPGSSAAAGQPGGGGDPGYDFFDSSGFVFDESKPGLDTKAYIQSGKCRTMINGNPAQK